MHVQIQVGRTLCECVNISLGNDKKFKCELQFLTDHNSAKQKKYEISFQIIPYLLNSQVPILF